MTAGHPIEITPVTTRAEVKAFIDFPSRLYRDDPTFVPRLFLQQKEQLSKENPYFEHSEAGFYLARSGGETIGRIGWFLNHHHVQFSGRRELFFGFFDAVNDQPVADALLAVVHDQGRSMGCDSILGPIEFSTNDTCGLLIEGFDRRPAILMPYNAPYYQDFLAHAGYACVQELHAYEVRGADRPEFLDPLADRITERLKERGITIRIMDFDRFDAEVESLFSIYQEVFSGNWGFMPLSRRDFLSQAKALRQVSIPDFVLIAEDKGRPIGYAVGVFDANEVFATFRNGRLLPFNVFRLPKVKQVSRLKILNLGLIPGYRDLGIDLVMYARIFETGLRLGLESAEASYVMGSNERMRRAILRVNGHLTKRYAIFQRDLTA